MKISFFSFRLLGSAVLSLLVAPYMGAQFSGGSGTPTDPYRIETAAQLDAVRTNLAASYVLTADIDLDQTTFPPLGSDVAQFSGHFNGNGHSISNWSFGDPNTNAGLFVGIAESGKVEHLTLANCRVSAANYAAGLLAAFSDGVIDDCAVSGSISGVTVAGYVGGLAGMSTGVTNRSRANVGITAPPSQYFSGACGGLIGFAAGAVRDCWADGTISRTPNQIAPPTGGLVGIGIGVIERCFATGSVEGSVYTGGFVGFEYDHTAISKCYATGPVAGQGYAVGGFAGVALGFIGDSYASGSVTCMNGAAGGFIGDLGSGEERPGVIARSYATGAIVSFDPFNERGFVSDTWRTSLVTDCFWNVETTGTALTFRDLGADFDIGATGLTTAQMQDPATYVAWDSVRVWMIAAGQYPILRPDGLALPTITTQPQDRTVDVGGSAELAVGIAGEGPFVYRWFHDDTLIADATAATLTIPTVQAADIGNYRVEVSNSVGPAYSYSAYLDVISPPTITQSPASQTLAVGESATFWVEASGSSSMTYQWRKDGVPIAGATDWMYFIPSVAATDAGGYTVVVSNELGSATSDVASLTVVPPQPVITQQPQNQNVAVGGVATFSVRATGAAPLWFQWYLDGRPIPGANDSTYVVNGVTFTDAGGYTVMVSNSIDSATSTPVFLTVLSAAGAPSVNWIYPYSTTAGGPNLPFRVTGFGFEPGAQIMWNGVALPSTRTNACEILTTIPAAYLASTANLMTVQIAVENPDGVLSNLVPFTITSSNVTSFGTGGAAPGGSTTASVTSTSTDPVTVSAVLQNNTLDSTATLSVATYATNPTSVPTVDIAGQYVDVQVLGATAADVAATNFYYPATVIGTAETDLALSYFDGTSWQPVLSSGGATPAKDTTDNVDGVTCGGKFTVTFDATSTPQITQLTGTVFTIGSRTALKKNATKQKPKITTEPADVTVLASSDAKLSVVVDSVGAVTYQWYFEGKKSGAIAGATSATLTLHHVSDNDAGTYSVTVTNANGSTTSKKATLTVLPAAPTITADPQSQAVSSGSAVTFSVTATGEGTLSYQWQLNGKAINGAKAATLALKNVAQADAGNYSVIVTNAGGSVTSGIATLTVQPPSIASLNPTTVVAGSGAFTLTVTGTNFVNGDVVRWSDNDCTTQFASTTTLKATIPANAIAAAKTSFTLAIAVRAPGGDLSNSSALTVTPKK